MNLNEAMAALPVGLPVWYRPGPPGTRGFAATVAATPTRLGDSMPIRFSPIGCLVAVTR